MIKKCIFHATLLKQIQANLVFELQKNKYKINLSLLMYQLSFRLFRREQT